MPQHHEESTANILDHIICNREDKITESGVIETGLSDHYMIYCTKNHNRHNTGQLKTIKIRSIRNYSKETYINILRKKNKARSKGRKIKLETKEDNKARN